MYEREPIAIVGIGCRFPAHASGPEGFWKLLMEGVDAMIDVPRDRWDHRRFYDPDPDRPGKIYVKQAAFLREGIDAFDALAFGISPREARYMDPQQRVLLEVSWEAFDDAGFPLEKMRGRNVGVFIGGFTLDSMVTQLAYENQHIIGSHSGPGATMTMLANRISYVFDLRGPSVAMDTACSSSLVATHVACQSIWRGESEIALAGGVNIMLRPGFPVVMCKGGFLSQHGRCMAFDERAAGYARGEGAGIAVLKPLGKALADGDRIYATILATGTNQDGRTQGISLPNRDAQAELVRRVLSEARVAPAEVRYVEAHGTGTQAGDPAEAGALDEVLRQGRRPGDKAWLGSVKTNIGHLEAAAGIAGLIKTALVLHHGTVPKNLHFEKPNPKIPFDRMCLEVPTAPQPLPAEGAVAGVNSFGYGGANAHALLRQHRAPQRKSLRPGRTGAFLLPLSARDPRALAARAEQIAEMLREPHTKLEDVVYTLAHRSAHHPYRAVYLAADRADLAVALAARPAASGQMVARPQTAFVFTGMGPQWWGMGRELMGAEPAFAAAMREVDALFQPLAGWSLVDALSEGEATSRVHETAVAQPTNFALQVALLALWRSWGIAPDAVVGHSVGEVAAAYAAGALSLQDAVTVSFHRSRLQATTAGQGTMLAAGLSQDEADAITSIYPSVSVAAINGVSSVTLAGDAATLHEVAQTLQEEGVFNRMLDVEVAYHSAQMDPLEDELCRCLADLAPQSTPSALYSTVTGSAIDGSRLDARYWWRNVREPVRLHAALTSLIADGFSCFVEVGPHPVLRSSIAEACRAEGVDGSVIPSIRRGEPELARMLTSLGELWTIGHTPEWDAVAPTDGTLTRLPRYPFTRVSYWNESETSRARYGIGEQPAHPMLLTRVPTALPTYETELTAQLLPWIDDHQIDGTVILPGAAYVEAALALATQLAPEQHIILKDLDFHRLLSVPPGAVIDLHVECDMARGRWRVASSERGSGSWTTHADGYLVADSRSPSDLPHADLAALRARCSHRLDVAGMYRALASRGLEYGPCFQTIAEMHVGDDEVLARISLPFDAAGYHLHPALLDGAFQAVVALVGRARDGAPIVPTGADRVELYRAPGTSAWAHLKLLHHTAREVQADLSLVDEAGHVCAVLRGLTLQPIPVAERDDGAPSLYGFEWQPKELGQSAGAADRSALVIAEPGALDCLGAALRRDGASVETLAIAPGFAARALSLLAEQAVTDVVLFSPRVDDRPLDALEWLGVELVALLSGIAARESAPAFTLASALDGDHQGPDLLGAPLWGLVRVARNEHPELRLRSIGMALNGTAAWSALAAEIFSHDAETEVRLVEDEPRHVRRLVALAEQTAEPQHHSETIHTREQNAVLAIDQIGALGSLHWRQIPRRAPGPRDIEIRVEASGINFKDLLKFSGQLHPRVTRDTFLGDACGMECVGEVVAVGSEVTRFSVGDRVLAAPAEGSFQSFVTTDESTATPAPKTLSPTDAAVLLPYLTAWHGLVNIARLSEGETVLIHSAAGGVGQCAVSIAKMVGARIIATASSEEKRAHLRAQGIEHVTDSRTLAFVDDVRRWTGGRGVDVVLSALTTDGLLESVRLLAPCGRFIDIGKKAFIDNDALPLRIFNDGLTYASIDMDRMFLERMPFCIDIVAECVKHMDAGKLDPLPTRVFGAGEVVDAFRTMAQGRHIGRLVIDIGDKTIEARPPVSERPLVRRDGSYVVTGGLGGFGLEVARWLAAEGAGGLLLLSRRGLQSPGAAEAVAALREQGVSVIAEALDVADRAALASALDRARRELGPIRGVFHAAMVLEDELIDQLTPAAFARVLSPKARGAWHLHELTAGDPIEHFVGFSSIAVAVGNAGQASYVAANAFLDGLAARRRALGLPGLSIQWGVLADVGVVTRNKAVGDVLEASGLIGLSNAQALAGLAGAMRQPKPELGVYRVDWTRWTEASGAASALPLYAKVRAGAGHRASPALRLARSLLTVPPEERTLSLAATLRAHIAELLRVDTEQVGLKQSVTELGVDSLLALELVTALQKQGFEVSVVDLMQGPTVMALADKTVHNLDDILRRHADDLLADVDDMSEQEVEALVAFLRDGGESA